MFARIVRRSAIAFLAGACIVLLATPASGRQSRQAFELAGFASALSNGAAQLTINNTGPEVVLYDRGVAPKTLDSATHNGQACRVQGNTWNCGPFEAQANQPYNVELHSPQGAFSRADVPFTMFASSDGRTDKGPFVIPWKEPPAGPCKCIRLAVTARGFASGQVTAPVRGTALISLTIHWQLTCSPGTGAKCTGKVTILKPKGSDVVVDKKTRSFTCKAPCNASSVGNFRFKATSVNDLDFDKREGKEFTFRLKKRCGNTTSTTPITLAFGINGFLDKKASDLNGNGIADGKEKK